MVVTCAAHLEDIVIISDRDLIDHWKKVYEILLRLLVAGLQSDLSKCHFASKDINYFDYIINIEEGIRMDTSKISSIVKWKSP